MLVLVLLVLYRAEVLIFYPVWTPVKCVVFEVYTSLLIHTKEHLNVRNVNDFGVTYITLSLFLI